MPPTSSCEQLDGRLLLEANRPQPTRIRTPDTTRQRSSHISAPISLHRHKQKLHNHCRDTTAALSATTTTRSMRKPKLPRREAHRCRRSLNRRPRSKARRRCHHYHTLISHTRNQKTTPAPYHRKQLHHWGITNQPASRRISFGILAIHQMKWAHHRHPAYHHQQEAY